MKEFPVAVEASETRQRCTIAREGSRLLALLCVGAFVLLALAPSLHAETVALTLDQAIALARESAPQLRRLESLREAARAGVDGAASARLPRIDLSANYSHNSDVPELATFIPDQGVVTIFPNLPDKVQTAATLQLPLYTGGRISSTIDAAASRLDAAGSDVLAADHDLVLETKAAFWSLVSAKERERVVRAALASYDQHLVDARNRLELGFAARNELLAVETERARAELQVLAARNAAELAEANVRRLTGIERDRGIEPVAQAGGDQYSRDDLEALVERALADRPELSALRARVSAADSATSATSAERMPQVGLAASYEYSNPNQKILPLEDAWNDTWSVGVGVSWNVFDGGRKNAAEAEARANAHALREQLRDVEAWVRLEVTQSLLELSNAKAAESVARAGLEAALENERVTRDRYREGVSPSSELLDAESMALRAGLDVTEAVSGVRIALARVEKAVGR
jgi:outer membrane protein